MANEPNTLSNLKKPNRKYITRIAIGVGGLGLLYFIFQTLMYVSTDDAQIQAHTLMLSPKVNGVVKKVEISDNEKVKAGQVLVEIDSRDYANALTSAEAELTSLQAREKDAETSFHRIAELYRHQAVSKQQYDTAQATFQEQSRRLSGAQAQVEEARLNLAYTQIQAPTDGIIAKKSVEPGTLAIAGQPIIGFVEAKERWVVANFKETDLSQIKPGKTVIVKVDAISGKSFEGVVDSISPSTGSIFTLLPPDNSTGNFTKVVQRVPVKIRLMDLSDSDVELLRAGLSADVKVRIHSGG